MKRNKPPLEKKNKRIMIFSGAIIDYKDTLHCLFCALIHPLQKYSHLYINLHNLRATFSTLNRTKTMCLNLRWSLSPASGSHNEGWMKIKTSGCSRERRGENFGRFNTSNYNITNENIKNALK